MKRLILVAILIFPVATLGFWLWHGYTMPKSTPLPIGQATNAIIAATNSPAGQTNTNAPAPQPK